MTNPVDSAVRSWRATAWIAGAFIVLVGIGMIAAHTRHKSSDPWRSPVLLELKARLLTEPRNEGLKDQIRQLDLGLRERYFRLLGLKSKGVYLLFGGALVLLVAVSRARQLNTHPPMPEPDPQTALRLMRRARLARNAVAVCGTIALAGLSTLAFTGKRSPLADPGLLKALLETNRTAAAPAYAVSREELNANWTRFRGPEGSGVAPQGITLTTQPDLIWQVPTPANGFNSPLVWKNRILFTGGNKEKREVLCLNANTGELEWRQTVIVAAPIAAGETPEIPEMTGYAASTAATDGERVYALFATGELAAFTLDGQPVWTKPLGPLDNPYGHASSLACWQDQVIVQLDQGDEDSRKSRIIAVDGRTGEVTWQKARPVGASWSTPIVIHEPAPPQVITLGLPWVIAYAAPDGSELWRAKLLEGEITPSPVFAAGRLILVDPGMYQLLAVQTDGRGDVSTTHTLWRVDGEMPDITSPVSTSDLVFTVTTDGTLSCFANVSGEAVWKSSLEASGEIQASPSVAGQVLLLLSTAGDLIGLRAEREFGELWRAQLEDEFYASPAFANGRVYLRGNKSVWCLGQTSSEIAQP